MCTCLHHFYQLINLFIWWSSCLEAMLQIESSSSRWLRSQLQGWMRTSWTLKGLMLRRSQQFQGSWKSDCWLVLFQISKLKCSRCPFLSFKNIDQWKNHVIGCWRLAGMTNDFEVKGGFGRNCKWHLYGTGELCRWCALLRIASSALSMTACMRGWAKWERTS